MIVTETKKHWYELNPSRLEMEKIAMSKLFPEFRLYKRENGELYWEGEIRRPIDNVIHTIRLEYDDKCVYEGSFYKDPAIFAYPVHPDFHEMFHSSNSFEEKLLDNICVYNRCLQYESPNEPGESIIRTAASLLIKVTDFLKTYRIEEIKRKECNELKQEDSPHKIVIIRAPKALIDY